MRVPVFNDVVMLIIKVGWLTGLVLGVDKRVNEVTFQSLEPFSTKNLKCIILDGVVYLIQRRDKVLSLKDKARLDVITKGKCPQYQCEQTLIFGVFSASGVPTRVF